MPDASAVASSQLTAFARFCEHETGRRFETQAALHEFSVADRSRFWELVLRWSELAWEGDAAPVCVGDACEDATFFPGLRLSYAENLLSGADDAAAIVSGPSRLTRRELRARVRGVGAHLRAHGVSSGDSVVAVAGNTAELAVAALSTASIGATFSTAASNMGTAAIVARFGQLAPTVLFTESGDARVAELAAALPTVRTIIALDDAPIPSGLRLHVDRLADIEPSFDDGPWERFPFNHPLFILFTSGTTGPPKCIVHGAGGTLLEHVKEHRLHLDLSDADTLLYQTSPAWMMWHWQLSALAAGATIVLHDGAVTGPGCLWEIVSKEHVTVFGTNPHYLRLCEDSGYSPRRATDLSALRTVLSTGSVLHDTQYDWARSEIGPLPVQSISGGTDILGCFVLGSPNLAVRRGWIQCRSLGLDVQAHGGELVCRNPFPSRPLGFVGDDGSRFHSTYFTQNPGVWTHGDLIEFDEQGHARIHGRSDATLNCRGVRIGPSEIYAAMRDVQQIRDAIAVERRPGDGAEPSIALLVVLHSPGTLDDELRARIRREISHNASALHVPRLIVEVPELPTTHSGKRSERAARDAVNGVEVANASALANPRSLAAIREAVAMAERSRLASGGRGETATERQVLEILEEVLEIAPLGVEEEFFDVGGTSLDAVRLFTAIHDRLAVDLPLSTLAYAPTARAIAALIDGPPHLRVPPVVPLRPGTGRPLFLVHSIWGDVLAMRTLALALDTDRPIYGLQARTLDPSAAPYKSIEEIAAAHLEAVRSVQPSGPYAFAGYSFGGVVAFAMACAAEAQGQEVEWLGLLDPRVHHRCLPPPLRYRFLVARFGRQLRSRTAARTRISRFRRERVLPWAPLTLDSAAATPLLDRVMKSHLEAFVAYRPAEYGGSATFISSEAGPIGADLCDPLPIWRRAVRGQLDVVRIAAGHDELIAAPGVPALAEAISGALGA